MTSLVVVLATLAPLAATPSTASLVAAPAAPLEGCPSARQVSEALQSRLPNSVVPANDYLWPAGHEILRSVLEVAPDGTLVRFSLVNARGDIQLRRTLSVASQGKLAECQALADTLAAIVERYLDFTAFDSGDSAAGDPDFDVAARAGSRAASTSTQVDSGRRQALLFVGAGLRTDFINTPGEAEGRLGAQVDLRRHDPRVPSWHLGLVLSAGVAAPRYSLPRTVNASMRRYPARLGVIGDIPAGRGWLEPMVALGVDLLVVDAPSHVSPGVSTLLEGSVAYRWDLGKHLFVRGIAAGGVALLRYDVLLRGETVPVFRTSRAYVGAGFETGVVFR